MKKQHADTHPDGSSLLSRRTLLTRAAPIGVGATLTTLAPQAVGAAAHTTQPEAVGVQSAPHSKSAMHAPLANKIPETVLASAMWIHGNALVVENTNAVAVTQHIGWGTEIAGISGQSSWFHIPIPSPVIIDGARPQLARAFLMFSIADGAGYISNVHFYDGPYNFKQFNGLYLTGDHREYLDASNTFTLDIPQTIYLALGISFHFQFAACIDGGCGPFWFSVSSAGGDFQI